MHSDARGACRGCCHTGTVLQSPQHLNQGGPAMKPSSCTPLYKGFLFFSFFLYKNRKARTHPPFSSHFSSLFFFFFPSFSTLSTKVYKRALRLCLQDTGSNQLWQKPASPTGMLIKRCVTIVISVPFAQSLLLSPLLPSGRQQRANDRAAGRLWGWVCG